MDTKLRLPHSPQQREVTLPPTFGLSWNNYMGALPQSNTPSPQWVAFFIQQRLDPQLHLAAEKGLLAPAALRSFERLYRVLPDISPESIWEILCGKYFEHNSAVLMYVLAVFDTKAQKSLSHSIYFQGNAANLSYRPSIHGPNIVP